MSGSKELEVPTNIEKSIEKLFELLKNVVNVVCMQDKLDCANEYIKTLCHRSCKEKTFEGKVQCSRSDTLLYFLFY